MVASDDTRLSVAIVNVHPGREDEFLLLAARLKELLERQQYCVQAQTIRDEGVSTCFYVVWQWVNADAAKRSHADREVNQLTTHLHRVGLVTYAINGARERTTTETDERRVVSEWNRRGGFDRRVRNLGPVGVERRVLAERRLGPRRRWARTPDIIAAARRARENADAQFSHFKVGAALETTDGLIVTGCNIENAIVWLDDLRRARHAMFKALSEGHPDAFSRIAIVADTEAPIPRRVARAGKSCGSSAATWRFVSP